MNTNQIEKEIVLQASVSRVWRALTSHIEFGQWFLVRIDGPFVVGKLSSGMSTYPGQETKPWRSTIKAMEPETYFAYSWHPYNTDETRDYSKEPENLVEFRLKAVTGGTLLTVRETGFDSIPPERRDVAYRRHEGGWTEQMTNIQTYVAKN